MSLYCKCGELTDMNFFIWRNNFYIHELKMCEKCLMIKINEKEKFNVNKNIIKRIKLVEV